MRGGGGGEKVGLSHQATLTYRGNGLLLRFVFLSRPAPPRFFTGFFPLRKATGEGGKGDGIDWIEPTFCMPLFLFLQKLYPVLALSPASL